MTSNRSWSANAMISITRCRTWAAVSGAHSRSLTSNCSAKASMATLQQLVSRFISLPCPGNGRKRKTLPWCEPRALGPCVPGRCGWHSRSWGPSIAGSFAALVGVAPPIVTVGPRRGRRTIWGGRAHVHTVLSMGTLVATRDKPRIQALYERLLAVGKVKKVALTTCRHKFLTILNAMLKHRTPWQAQEVQG